VIVLGVYYTLVTFGIGLYPAGILLELSPAGIVEVVELDLLKIDVVGLFDGVDVGITVIGVG
jgi:hypothetical protein